MPSLYVGGYFSQLIISALYPLVVAENVGGLLAGDVTDIKDYEIYVDTAGGLSEVMLTAINLMSTLTTTYTNVESVGGLVTALVSDINIQQIVITYSNTEVVGGLSQAAITGINLQQIVITYSNTEFAGGLSTAAVTGITLV